MFRINYNAEEVWHPFMELVRTGMEDLINCCCAMEISDEKHINEELTHLVRCLEEGGGMIYEKILEK
jgi:hypothetical protein